MDWNVPSAYIGPYHAGDKSDVLMYCGFIRAGRDGHFGPFHSNFIPELGAPYSANWNDWPNLEYLPLYAIGLLARVVGIFAALNVELLACHILAGLAFYFAARYRRVNITWSFTAALAFALAPFLVMQSPHHPMVTLCWHVPLFLLIWSELASERGVEARSKFFWFAIAISFVTGVQNPYFTAIFCQLVALTAVAMFLRTRDWRRHLISPLCFLATTAFAFVLMNLGPWIYNLRHGHNPSGIVREFQWVEIYALKPLEFFIPPLNHRWEIFRSIAQWRAGVAILHDEGSYLGIVGLCALSILLIVTARIFVKRDFVRVPFAFWQLLWIFAFFTTDSLNGIAGALGFTFLRAACRFSIVVLAIALLFAAEWLTTAIRRRHIAFAIAAAVIVLVIVDQVPLPLSRDEKTLVASQIAADRKFVADIESALPDGAMVFQLPVMEYPDSPLRDVLAYDHLRPYLFTQHLRFSFGSMKGRPREEWQHDVAKLSLPDSIAEIKGRGFSALYVNRKAYPKNAADLEESLRALGYDRKIDNQLGDTFCVLLR
ncbi:MAG: hypothetical protein QOG48_2080 [Verrucomicrobiota bacterium]